MITPPAGAGIDAGGTTFKCGVTGAGGHLIATRRVPVTTPPETLQLCADFFADVRPAAPFATLGIASFGPLDVDPASPDYGTILETPKPGWAGTNLRSFFASALGVTPIIDTDVNGALLAEIRRGAAHGCTSAAYMTIGTGIGAGLMASGRMLARPSHPEFGHISVRRHPLDADFAGNCPFHGDCLEGMASASAIRARFGEPSALAPDAPAWDAIADYLAQACRTLTLTFRPQRIVLGGGLMLAPHLLGRVRAAYTQQIAGYLGRAADSSDALITTPGLGDDAGLIGAVELGLDGGLQS